MSAKNEMDLGEIPAYLLELTQVERATDRVTFSTRTGVILPLKGFVLRSQCIRHLIVASDVQGFSSVSPSKLKTLHRLKWAGNAILQSRYLVLGSTHSIAPVSKSTIPPWDPRPHSPCTIPSLVKAGRSSPCHYPNVASWSWLKVTH
jgi:hypothetical protein